MFILMIHCTRLLSWKQIMYYSRFIEKTPSQRRIMNNIYDCRDEVVCYTAFKVGEAKITLKLILFLFKINQ